MMNHMFFPPNVAILLVDSMFNPLVPPTEKLAALQHRILKSGSCIT